MRTEVLLRDSLVAILRGVAEAHGDLALRLNDRDALCYSAGFVAAIRAVGKAVGIDAPLDGESGTEAVLLQRERSISTGRTLSSGALPGGPLPARASSSREQR